MRTARDFRHEHRLFIQVEESMTYCMYKLNDEEIATVTRYGALLKRITDAGAKSASAGWITMPHHKNGGIFTCNVQDEYRAYSGEYQSDLAEMMQATIAAYSDDHEPDLSADELKARRIIQLQSELERLSA
jgi:hypothetical protein